MSEQAWQDVGNLLLVLMTIAYAVTTLLFFVLRPRDLMEWATTLKVFSMFFVLLNGVAVVYGIGTERPLRVVIFAVATLFSWVFTVVAWRDWVSRR